MRDNSHTSVSFKRLLGYLRIVAMHFLVRTGPGNKRWAQLTPCFVLVAVKQRLRDGLKRADSFRFIA